MDSLPNAAELVALKARRNRAAEQRVRDMVLANTFKDQAEQPVGEKLRASHFALTCGVSLLALSTHFEGPLL